MITEKLKFHVLSYDQKSVRILFPFKSLFLLANQKGMKYLFLFLMWIQILCGQSAPEELGKVSWLRDADIAKSESAKTNKPILILFQEIPGCSTCKNYGRNILSHPMVVEAIEQNFIPLAIYNNKSGKDHEVLQFFNEPAWNNPVVRIVDSKLNDICERLSGNYSSFGLISKINASFVKRGKVVPEYLRLLEEEFYAESGGTEKAYVGMYCFWSGEKCFAQAPGVVSTRSGYMKGSEVVEVQYNPKLTNLDAILRHGKEMHCADRLYHETPSPNYTNSVQVLNKGDFTVDKELKYYIFQSFYRFIPMTDMQAMKVNLALGSNKSPEEFLCPAQLKMVKEIKNNPGKKYKNKIGMPVEDAWPMMLRELKS